MIDKIGGIEGKDDFIRFLKDLAMDYKEHSGQWVNTTVDDCLLQMASWIEDYSECSANDIMWDKVDFRVLASILYMGKIYE
jgi:hypothetical protein